MFETTGRPPLFWNTQLRLQPLNSVWDSLIDDEPDNSDQEQMDDDDISSRVWPSMPTITMIPFLNEDSELSEQEKEVEAASLGAETRQSAEHAPHRSPLSEDMDVNLGNLIAQFLNSESTANHDDDHLN
jgi:hypothetical protein